MTGDDTQLPEDPHADLTILDLGEMSIHCADGSVSWSPARSVAVRVVRRAEDGTPLLVQLA